MKRIPSAVTDILARATHQLNQYLKTIGLRLTVVVMKDKDQASANPLVNAGQKLNKDLETLSDRLSKVINGGAK